MNRRVLTTFSPANSFYPENCELLYQVSGWISQYQATSTRITMAQLLTIVSPTPRRRMGSRAAASMLLLCCLVIMSDPSKAFVSSFHTSSPLLDPIGVAWRGQSRYFQSIHINQHQNVLQRSQWERSSKEGSITSLNSFMGSDGGLFGIGTPELVCSFLLVVLLMVPGV